MIMKFYEVRRVLLLETAVKAKMLTFALLTEKRVIVSFRTYFLIYRQRQRIRKTETTKEFC